MTAEMIMSLAQSRVEREEREIHEEEENKHEHDRKEAKAHSRWREAAKLYRDFDY